MTMAARTSGSIIFTVAIIAVLMLAGPASAHIKNDASQFPDIEFSDARFDIVILVGAGIIPETPVFEPDTPMMLTDLAVWAALFNNLGEGGETPDTEALAKAALDQGLVQTLDGPATYADINDLFFQGQLVLEQATSTPTRAEAARFIAAMLATPEGVVLLEKRGLQAGPTGEITQVESRASADGGSSYFISMGGTTMPMYAHGRVANGPTDLVQWQGRMIRKSFIRNQGELTLWMYLEAEPVPIAGPEPITVEGLTATDAEPAVQTNHRLLFGLLGGVLVLGVLLFFRRKRVG